MLAQEPVEGGNPEGVKVLRADQSQNKANAPKVRPNYYIVGPNLGGYTQWVRWHAPTKMKSQENKMKRKKDDGEWPLMQHTMRRLTETSQRAVKMVSPVKVVISH